jgi:hypothetical protein
MQVSPDAYTHAPCTDDDDEENGHNDDDDVGLAYLQSSKVHVSTFSLSLVETG